MGFCSNCGQQVSDLDMFCKECGNKTVPVQSATNVSDQSTVNGADIGALASLEDLPGNAPADNPAGFSVEQTPVDTPPPKKRRWPYVLAGIMVVLLLSTTLVYSMGNFSAPTTARLAAADTELYICVKPNLFQAYSFKKLQEIYQSNPETQKALEKFNQEIKNEMNIGFDDDIKPWLGKEMAFIMPKMTEEHGILLIESKDDAKAAMFIQKLTEEQNPRQEIYHDITVTNADGMMAALVDGFVMISDDENLFHAMIDRKLGESSNNLEDNADYKKIAASLPWNRSVLGYLNINEMSNHLKQNNYYSGMPMQSLDVYRCMGIALSTENNGFRYDYIMTCNKVPAYMVDRPNQKEEAKAVLNMFPDDTIGFVRSSNLINTVQEQYQDYYQMLGGEMGISEIENELGIDFEKDFLDKLRGDIAMAIMPPKESFFGESNIPVSGMLLLGVKDQQYAKDVIEDLVNFVEENQGTVDQQQVNGMACYSFIDDYSEENIFTIGIRDNLAILGSSADATKSVSKTSNGGVSKQLTYQKTFDMLPKSWEPQLYIDIERLINLLPVEDMNSEEKEMMALLKPIKSIAMASAAIDADENTIQAAAVINIE